MIEKAQKLALKLSNNERYLGHIRSNSIQIGQDGCKITLKSVQNSQICRVEKQKYVQL